MPESPEARVRRLARSRTYNKKWREANSERQKKYFRDWRKGNPEYGVNYMKDRREGRIGPFGPEDGEDWQGRNREDFLKIKRENTNRRRREIFLEALQHYSGKEEPECYCCGEKTLQLLCLDHVDGGGNEHRREIGKIRVYVWAKREGWPPLFRVACHSCNTGAHLNGGVCPHQSASA